MCATGSDTQACVTGSDTLACVTGPDTQACASNVSRNIREFRQETPTRQGAKYTGEWSGKYRDGEGVQVWPGGQRYVGQFVRGGVHGEGVYTQPDGLRYAGQWNSGKQHGHGSEFFQEKTRYVGQYKAGKFAGMGLYISLEGSVYEGQFNDDCVNGEGIYLWVGGNRGRKYQGQWKNNNLHGRGVFSFADGRKYCGEYVDNKKHGYGTFNWPDGREYAGQWSYGAPHGMGVYTDAHRVKKSGMWKHGEETWTEDGGGKCCMQMPMLRSTSRENPAPQPAIPVGLDGGNWEAHAPGGVAKENAEAHAHYAHMEAATKKETRSAQPQQQQQQPPVAFVPAAEGRHEDEAGSNYDSDYQVVALPPAGFSGALPSASGELQDILEIHTHPSLATRIMEGLYETPREGMNWALRRSPRDRLGSSPREGPRSSPREPMTARSLMSNGTPRTILESEIDEHGDDGIINASSDQQLLIDRTYGMDAPRSRIVSL